MGEYKVNSATVLLTFNFLPPFSLSRLSFLFSVRHIALIPHDNMASEPVVAEGGASHTAGATDSDKDTKSRFAPDRKTDLSSSSSAEAAEATVIPSGTVDPVYDAKARVLNKAVSQRHRQT